MKRVTGNSPRWLAKRTWRNSSHGSSPSAPTLRGKSCLWSAGGYGHEGASISRPDHSAAAEFDLALAFWMVHEVPDQESLLQQIGRALKPGGRFLLAEPKVHVGQAAFDRTVGLAEKAGLTRVKPLDIFFSRAVLMIKTS